MTTDTQNTDDTDDTDDSDDDSRFDEGQIVASELESVGRSDADHPLDPKDEIAEGPGEIEYYEADLENLQGAVAEADEDTDEDTD